MTNASAGTELSAECAVLLRGFGLAGEDLDGPLAPEGMITPETVADAATADAPAELYDELQATLARSARGVRSSLRYWNQAPAYQLSDALAPFGYEVEFAQDPGAADGFEVVLTGDGRQRRMTFSYPDSEYGDDNYPALVDAVERRLLPDDDLTFVLLDRDDAWWFVVVERERLAALRDRFGRRVRAFDRPLLAERQPAAFGPVVPQESVTRAEEPVAGIAVEGGIEDAFECVEREAVTGPVRPEPGSEDVDDEVRALIGTEETPVVADVSGETLDDLVEGDRDGRLVFDTTGRAFDVPDREFDPASTAGRTLEFDLDATGGGSDTARRDRSRDDRRDGERGAGLADQVAETLFGDGPTDGEAGEDGDLGPSGDENRGLAGEQGRDRPSDDGETPVFTAVEPHHAGSAAEQAPPTQSERRDRVDDDDSAVEGTSDHDARSLADRIRRLF